MLTGGAPFHLHAVPASSHLSVDDPGSPDPLEVSLGNNRNLGGGYDGGGGAFVAHLILEALDVAPEGEVLLGVLLPVGEVLLGVLLPVLILVSSFGHWDWDEQ